VARELELTEFDVLLRVDGTTAPYPPAGGKLFTLQELQRAVGGYIEIVHLPGGFLLVVNEEGRLHGLPHNARASALAVGLVVGGEDIRGDALLCRVGRID